MGSSWSGRFCGIVASDHFGSRHRLWKVLANECGRESKPGCKEGSLENGDKVGTVEILDEIRESLHGVDAVDKGQADG